MVAAWRHALTLHLRWCRWLRDQFGVDVTSYMMSLCGDQALRQLGELGKSRSVFFLSHGEQQGLAVQATTSSAAPQPGCSKQLHMQLPS